jgi:hypothetical protein
MSLRLGRRFTKQRHVARKNKVIVVLLSGALLLLSSARLKIGQSAASDPGVRGGSIDSGPPLDSVATTPGASQFFPNGHTRFKDIEVVAVRGTPNIGIGPRFNPSLAATAGRTWPALQTDPTKENSYENS